MAWTSTHDVRETRALAPSVAALMNVARHAERRPLQHDRRAAGPPFHNGMAMTNGNWTTGRPGWSADRDARKWVDHNAQWRGWGNDGWASRDGQWAQRGWRWNGWAPQTAVDDHGNGQVADSRHRAATVGQEGCWEGTFDWDDYIITKGWSVRVELNGTELGDSDLESLVRHLDEVMHRFVEQTSGKYVLNIDLSCNLYISDDGISDHLAPFLQRWPVCHRLKLYKTSIGDGALAALSSWAASGHVHELHLSDLSGEVTGEGVLAFLSEVHQGGKYPYWNSDGVRCALWLRLEHNGVPNVDKLVSRAHAQGISLAVLSKLELEHVRPGMPSCQSAEEEEPAMKLVLFRRQELRVSRQWISAMQSMQPVSEELQQLVGAASSGTASVAAESLATEAARGGKTYTPATLQKFLGPSQRCQLQEKSSARNTRSQAALRSDRSVRAERAGVEVEGSLSRAVHMLLACPTGLDSEVSRRWRCHLQRAKDPESEARRIRGMTARLCTEGYLDPTSLVELQDAQASSPSNAPTDDTSSAASGAMASEPVDSPGSVSLTAKPEDESSTDDVLSLAASVLEAPP